MVYKWKVPNVPVDAQAAGEYLTALEVEHGKLTPALVLDESKDANALLHDCFEWDDAIAAEKHRLEQARHLIGNITVEVAPLNAAQSQPVRCFVNVTREGESRSSYISTNVVMKDAYLRKQLLCKFRDELRAFQTRNSTFEELRGVFAAIDDFAKKLQQGDFDE